MCGIFAISTTNKNINDAAKHITDGLKSLDYRGYDSWGITVKTDQGLKTHKQVGKLENDDHLTLLPTASIGIGHTRWATHGGITHANAHPHHSSDGKFVLAQNGIVENYQELKQELKDKGWKFTTETDTEVIVRQIEEQQKHTPDLTTAIRQTILDLKGRNTIIALTTDGEIIAARNGSPLVIGLTDSNDTVYLSSDTLSFATVATKIIVIDNGQLIRCRGNQLEIFDVKTGNKILPKIEKIQLAAGVADKEGYPHFMLKEIHEASYVINQVVNHPDAAYAQLAKAIKNSQQVYTIGSGTTGLAAAQTAYYLRELANINAISLVGAEAQSYYHLFSADDLIIAPSQSGETADVLEVLEVAKSKGTKLATFVNMPGSMMTRMSDFPFMANAGPELCVMATKTFVSQLAWGYLVAKTTEGKITAGKTYLEDTAKIIDQYLSDKTTHISTKKLAQKLITAKDIFLMGKSQNLQIVMEGMVKIIEGTYKHAHGISAGDLKHYAITIIETGVPVIAVISDDQSRADMLSAVNEVKARGATIIAIAPENNEAFDEYLRVPQVEETSAIINVIPLQLLAYYMTVALGNNVDKPRNIAKSVTVK